MQDGDDEDDGDDDESKSRMSRWMGKNSMPLEK